MKTNWVELILKPGKEKSLQRFHPWVFSGAVSKTKGNPEEGDLVKVFAADGRFLATGHYQPDSIYVRILSFEDIEINREFWFNRLNNALQSRLTFIDCDNTNVFRLIHGEGDYLPGLIVDIYSDVAVIQAHSVGMYRAMPEIAEVLMTLPGLRISSVYNKSTSTVPSRWKDKASDGFLIGSSPMPVVVTENGLKFNVNPVLGQKTGFFIDQRENRALLATYAKGKRVANLFSYTGGFSVYAMAAGATEVFSVDASQPALELAGENAALNDFSKQHVALNMDIVRQTSELPGTFDIMVVDPPAFAKHTGHRTNAIKAYARLNAAVMEKMNPGGLMFTFSCSQAVSRDDFRSAIYSAALQAGKQVRILHMVTQGPDHPVNIFHPEGEYLKGLVVQVG
ncbi:MAG: RlmI/RlmK family 23S rRNA methyltransferase [Bacteroidetes bacterium HGW-Bacteroidetes-21]|nr:MAG: RlmI/RlmK family 23S rRNA methyltransferase [Bacteroidetes bacterium HGW-Bacteroidetes-21]